MNKNELQTFLNKKYPWLTDNQFILIEKYKQFLQQKNKIMNLTRLDSDDKFYSKYILESLLPFINLNFIDKDWSIDILDIGSGSGIPGVVLKIIYPNLKITLLDSNSKKTTFLKELINHLGLTNIFVVNKRAEEYIKDNYEKYDLVTSRAVANLSRILELSAGFVKLNGLIIEPKSINADVEYNDALVAIKVLGLKLKSKINYILEQNTHTIFMFEKIVHTNKKYPRCWSQIIKNPL